MKTFEITFTRFGTAIIEANTEAEAMEKANLLKDEDITWSDDDWQVTDAQETE